MKKVLTTTLYVMMAALFCSAVAGAAKAATANPELYYVLHSVHNADAPDVDAGSVGFHRATLFTEAQAGSVHLQPLWIRSADAPERDAGTAALDPRAAMDADIIAVLRSGFLSTLASSGAPGPLRSADADAFARLKKHDPQLAQRQLQMGQAAGLRPMRLPVALHVGQHVRVPMMIEPHGPFMAEVRVLDVSSQTALLALKVAEKGLRGDGRAAVRLADGMPIELRMQLAFDARGRQPASLHEVHVATMRHAPHLEMAQDLSLYQDYVGQIQQALAGAPFDGRQGDPSMYSLSEVPAGALQPHMVASDALPALERNMGFSWVQAAGRGAPGLAIGALSRLSRGRTDEAVLVAQLGPVLALDAAGDVLADVVVQTVLPRIYLGDRFTAAEHEPGFPFRLPLGLDPSARERIHRLRATVMAEVYQWQSEETIPLHHASSVNAGVELQSISPTRLSVLHARASQQGSVGLWTVAVPLDAQGKEIPSRQLSVLPLVIREVSAQDELPLAWESRDVPYRVEIATQAPIHQVQLRHYLWTLEPRMWDFHKRQ